MIDKYTCRICGGSIVPIGDGSHGQCEYCGDIVIIPSEDLKWLNGANQARQLMNFPAAQTSYRRLTKMSPADPEGWWGCALSEYGVTYVNSGSGFRPVVTLEKFDSILDNADYKHTLELALPEDRARYEALAGQIHQTQKNMVAAIQKNRRYDVFLCVSDTEVSENGKTERSYDAKLADSIYRTLQKNDFSVFYSTKDYPDWDDPSYDPALFAALHRSTVMLVVGTSAAQMNQPRTRHEWTRFNRIIRSSSQGGKFLLPVYADMAPEDIPFNAQQALNANTISFQVDLVSNLMSLTGRKKEEPAKAPTKADIAAAADQTVRTAVERGNSAIEQGVFDQAVRFFNEALDLDVNCTDAWLGLCSATLNLNKPEDAEKALKQMLKTTGNESQKKEYSNRAANVYWTFFQKRSLSYPDFRQNRELSKVLNTALSYADAATAAEWKKAAYDSIAQMLFENLQKETDNFTSKHLDIKKDRSTEILKVASDELKEKYCPILDHFFGVREKVDALNKKVGLVEKGYLKQYSDLQTLATEWSDAKRKLDRWHSEDADKPKGAVLHYVILIVLLALAVEPIALLFLLIWLYLHLKRVGKIRSYKRYRDKFGTLPELEAAERDSAGKLQAAKQENLARLEKDCAAMKDEFGAEAMKASYGASRLNEKWSKMFSDPQVKKK